MLELIAGMVYYGFGLIFAAYVLSRYGGKPAWFLVFVVICWPVVAPIELIERYLKDWSKR